MSTTIPPPVKDCFEPSKFFDSKDPDCRRLIGWLERRVSEYCDQHRISLNEASELTGNSRSFLSGLFRKGSNLGASRFFKICDRLSINVDAHVAGIAAGRQPTIDEVTDIVAEGATEARLSAILQYLVIYAQPASDTASPHLLHLGERSLAANILPNACADRLQKAVDNFPESDRRKLITAYQLAASGTCLVSIEALTSHTHGQPGLSQIRYKRLLFPIADFRGRPAVGVHASPTSSSDRAATSSSVE